MAQGYIEVIWDMLTEYEALCLLVWSSILSTTWFLHSSHDFSPCTQVDAYHIWYKDLDLIGQPYWCRGWRCLKAEEKILFHAGLQRWKMTDLGHCLREVLRLWFKYWLEGNNRESGSSCWSEALQEMRVLTLSMVLSSTLCACLFSQNLESFILVSLGFNYRAHKTIQIPFRRCSSETVESLP